MLCAVFPVQSLNAMLNTSLTTKNTKFYSKLLFLLLPVSIPVEGAFPSSYAFPKPMIPVHLGFRAQTETLIMFQSRSTKRRYKLGKKDLHFNICMYIRIFKSFEDIAEKISHISV